MKTAYALKLWFKDCKLFRKKLILKTIAKDKCFFVFNVYMFKATTTHKWVRAVKSKPSRHFNGDPVSAESMCSLKNIEIRVNGNSLSYATARCFF